MVINKQIFHFSTGEVYRGKLIEAEDNMNCQMTQITVTYRDGRMATLENVYIRGSKIRFLILPDMLKNAPMFKNKSGSKSGTAGRGKSAILRAQGEIMLFTLENVVFIEVFFLAARGRGRGGPPQGGAGNKGPPGSKGPWQGSKLTVKMFLTPAYNFAIFQALAVQVVVEVAFNLKFNYTIKYVHLIL